MSEVARYDATALHKQGAVITRLIALRRIQVSHACVTKLTKQESDKL